MYILCVISLYGLLLHLCNTCCIAFWYLRMGNNSSRRPNLMYLLILCSDINQHFLTYISFSNGKLQNFTHKNMVFVQTLFFHILIEWFLVCVLSLYNYLVLFKFYHLININNYIKIRYQNQLRSFTFIHAFSYLTIPLFQWWVQLRN